MKNIRIKTISSLKEAQGEIAKIGSDKRAIALMAPKAVHLVIKVEELAAPTANILKQEMLSVGGECAIARDALTLKQKKTDILLMGTIKQYERVLEKLALQPFGLKELGNEIRQLLRDYDTTWSRALKIGNKNFRFGSKTYIMGILNVTPDSFAGEGILDPEKAVERALQLEEQGADIIDVGGESSRPFSKPVSLEEELRRVMPVLKKLTSRINIPFSIDTYKSKVAEKALKLGASIVNDISGLRTDKKMPSVVAKHKAKVVIMHMKGTPRTMQVNPFYKDVISEIYDFLNERINFAQLHKIKKENIIVDPGLGFGKRLEDNFEIMHKLNEFKSLGCPLLVGPSRKSFIGKILDLPVEERLEGTLGAVSACIANGADIVRAHDVKECVRAAKIMDALVR